MLLLALLGSARAGTWTVDPSGGGDFATIGGAIAAAAAGDEIVVLPGTYAEAVDLGGKDLHLRSREGAEATTITSSATNAVTFDDGETAAAILEGFTITSPIRALHVSNASPILRDVVFEGSGSLSVWGGAAYLNGGSPTFEGCTFDGNTGQYGGHVAVVGGATPTFDETTFRAGTAWFGGAIYVSAGSATVTGGAFEDHVASSGGGAVFVEDDMAFVSLGADFRGNEATNAHGSAIWGDARASVTIAGGELSDNGPASGTATYWGAIFLQLGATADVSGATFLRNDGAFAAAIGCYLGCTLVVEDSAFEDQSAQYGAIGLWDGGDLTVTGSTFDGNTATAQGGAIYVYKADVTVSDTTFDANTAAQGGAVLLAGAGTAAFTDVDFTANAANGAGAFYAWSRGAATTFERAAFVGNTAANGAGGAIIADVSSDVTLTDAILDGNTALHSGGAVLVQNDSTLTLDRVDATGNSCGHYGGAAIAYLGASDALVVRDSTFVGNEAGLGGGALTTSVVGALAVSDSVFEGNRSPTTGLGGALHTYGTTSRALSNLVFCANEAAYGGALYSNGTSGSDAWTNVAFHENTALTWGGAIDQRNDPNTVVTNASFVGNTAPEGGAVRLAAASPDYRNALFAFTAAGDAVHAADAGATSTTFAYSDFWANTAADVSGTITAVSGTGNLAVDPRLAGFTLDGACGDALSLRPDSPLVDAGDPSILDGDGSPSDIGAWGGPSSGVVDADADGWLEDVDCDDADALSHPEAAEIPYDRIDQDCDGADLVDVDGDGVDAVEAGGADCDDGDPDVWPGAPDDWYDGVDSDCDGADDYDADGDGHRSDAWGGADCDDADPAVNPDAAEIWYDGIDQDCDDRDRDPDGDGHDAVAQGGDDCDDADPGVNPDAEEVWYDGVDQDCDGRDDDRDGDGFGVDDDCDDDDPAIHTGCTSSRAWAPDGDRGEDALVGSGCGCAGAGGGASGWAALLALLVTSRRGSRAAGPARNARSQRPTASRGSPGGSSAPG